MLKTKKYCKYCKKELLSISHYSRIKFCSHSCSAKYSYKLNNTNVGFKKNNKFGNKKHSEETKKKIGDIHRRLVKKECLMCKLIFTGRPCDLIYQKFCSINCSRNAHKNENHYNWKGGVTSLNEKIRKSIEYKLWRKAVFQRDNHTCVWCGIKGNINADHIKPFALFPELRFAIDNGRTLCEPCHRKTETWGYGTIRLKNKLI